MHINKRNTLLLLTHTLPYWYYKLLNTWHEYARVVVTL